MENTLQVSDMVVKVTLTQKPKPLAKGFIIELNSDHDKARVTWLYHGDGRRRKRAIRTWVKLDRITKPQS